MKHWAFPGSIAVLLFNVAALLLTFLAAKSVPIVLSLAVLADLVVVIALVSRSRTRLAMPVSTAPTVIRSPAAPDIDVDTNTDTTSPKEYSEENSLAKANTDPGLFNTIEELLVPAPKFESGFEDRAASVRQDHYEISDEEDLLVNSQWLKLVQECIELEGDLTNLYEYLDDTSRHIVDHTTLRIQEMLERSNVEIIADEHEFNRARHETKPKHPIPSSGTPITTTLHPGFAVGRRVLRRAQVQADEIIPEKASLLQPQLRHLHARLPQRAHMGERLPLQVRVALSPALDRSTPFEHFPFLPLGQN